LDCGRIASIHNQSTKLFLCIDLVVVVPLSVEIERRLRLRVSKHRLHGLHIRTRIHQPIAEAVTQRPGLDALLSDAQRHRFDVVMVWAFDRMARSVRHFLELLDELNHLGIEFVSFRESIDTSGPLGRAMVVIVGAIAELERNLIVERVKAGMRRAKLDGRQIGRSRLDMNREQIVHDRRSGLSLTQVAKKHGISRARDSLNKYVSDP